MKERPGEFYHDIIVGIVSALEAKDYQTADHSLRVSDITERVCAALGLSFEQTETIHMAAHVHDIGKIGIPDAILSKPGKLSPEEWDVVKSHPRIGADILKGFTGLNDVAEIVLHHHERWDGKGYPDGLKGEEIPFGSRIIAVCDSIDAMMSKRSYREMYDAEKCRKEIRRNSGVMYDPKVVLATLNNWDFIIEPVFLKEGQ